jgi:hypothetical protein
LQRLLWAIAIGRKAFRGEMDLVAERLEMLWRSLGRGKKRDYKDEDS